LSHFRGNKKKISLKKRGAKTLSLKDLNEELPHKSSSSKQKLESFKLNKRSEKTLKKIKAKSEA
jgi:hypothetical protein